MNQSEENPRESPGEFEERVDGAKGDPEEGKKVDSLIEGGGLASLLEEGAFQGADGDGTLTATEKMPMLSKIFGSQRVGMQIGRYQLVEEIGEGGFGMVYRAEQAEPVARTVALKIIKPGMDSREIIARFEAERQTLAMMEHPNIATVLDAGTTEDGRLYFVMEMVKGIPITKFCDRNRYTTRQRLEIFLQVCAAIQHAHQKGIIHRDIKPSNILIAEADGRPVVKVIDFGIAKALEQSGGAATLVTQLGQIVGTPQYMSPEQADDAATDIDTRSDIYSLGVLLYELLTGATPIDPQELRKAGFGGMQRLIREGILRKPSTRITTRSKDDSTTMDTRGEAPSRIVQMLRGDLDWIVMKALEKERDRRYETARGFARDIECFLHHEPVSASPPTAFYLMRKFAARHRGLIAAVSAIAISLIAGVVGMTLLYFESETNRRTAVHNLGIAEAQRKRAEEATAAEQQERARAEAESDRRRGLLYASDMQIAGRNWTSPEGTARPISRLLSAHVPKSGEADLREFTWRHQWLALNRGSEVVVADPVLLDATPATNGQLLTLGRDMVLRRWSGHGAKPQSEHDLGVNWREGDLAALTPDGKRVVHVRPGRIRVFDTTTGDRLQNLRGIQNPFRITLSADSRHLGVLEAESMLLFTVNLETGGPPRRRGRYKGRYDQFPIALGPDAGGVMIGNLSGTGTVSINWERPEILPGRHPATIQSLAWSANGARLASGDGSGVVYLRDFENRTETKSPKSYTTGVMALSFSPDGRLLALGGKDGGITVIDAEALDEVARFKGHSEQILFLRFSDDGRRLASSSLDGTARLWDVHHQPDYRRLTLPHVGVTITNGGAGNIVRFQELGGSNHIAVTDGALQSGDRILEAGKRGSSMLKLNSLSAARVVELLQGEPGSTLAYRVVSDQAGETKVRDVFLQRSTNSVNHINSYRIRFSPNGRWLVTRGAGKVALLDWTGQRPVQWLPYIGTTFAFSPDSRLLAFNHMSTRMRDARLILWDIEQGREVDSWSMPQVGDLDFSPDGKYLAVGRGMVLRMMLASPPGLVRVLNLATREFIPLEGHHGFVSGLQFAPGGNKLAFASHDGAMQVYDTENWSRLFVTKPVDERLISLKWSPDGEKIVAGGWNGSLYVWSSEGELIDTLEGHSSSVVSLDFSPDHRTLASCSRDMTVKLWDFAVRKQLRSLGAHDGVVVGVAFSRDGKALVTGGLKTDILVWPAASLDQITENREPAAK